MNSFPTEPGLDEQARAAAAALSSEQLAAVRQHFLGYFASLHRHHCTTGTQRNIRKQILHFLADAAADTETDAELAQYLILACLLHEQQKLPEHLTTAGATIAEAILTRAGVKQTLTSKRGTLVP